MTLPGPDQSPSFATDIKTLFRPLDRESMKVHFDLWSYEDVSRHAQAILDRLQKGTMPCDGAWSSEKVDVFHRWVSAGNPE